MKISKDFLDTNSGYDNNVIINDDYVWWLYNTGYVLLKMHQFPQENKFFKQC